MKRLTLAALLAAAAFAAACDRSPAAPEASRAPADAAYDGYLGSGNRRDSTLITPP
jgi:hypothetical protein